LVIDDEPAIREVLVEYLKEQGDYAETAVDGREGLDKYRQGIWDLVMTDGLMPDMNGKELAVAIKDINPATPVFLVSGSADQLHNEGDEGSPIDLVIRKPFTRQALSAALARVRAST
jgi:CheY-like chemotaxis protein